MEVSRNFLKNGSLVYGCCIATIPQCSTLNKRITDQAQYLLSTLSIWYSTYGRLSVPPTKKTRRNIF
jgi:hypothetical protein